MRCPAGQSIRHKRSNQFPVATGEFAALLKRLYQDQCSVFSNETNQRPYNAQARQILYGMIAGLVSETLTCIR